LDEFEYFFDEETLQNFLALVDAEVAIDHLVHVVRVTG